MFCFSHFISQSSSSAQLVSFVNGTEEFLNIYIPIYKIGLCLLFSIIVFRVVNRSHLQLCLLLSPNLYYWHNSQQHHLEE